MDVTFSWSCGSKTELIASEQVDMAKRDRYVRMNSLRVPKEDALMLVARERRRHTSEVSQILR